MLSTFDRKVDRVGISTYILLRIVRPWIGLIFDFTFTPVEELSLPHFWWLWSGPREDLADR